MFFVSFLSSISITEKKERKQTLPVTRYRSSGPLGALLSSPALDVRLPTALQVLQDNPREGWEDGTPPPHRDFKARHAVRGQLVFIRFSRRVLSIFFLERVVLFKFFLRILSVFLSKIGSIFSNMARIWLQIGPSSTPR